MLVRAPREKSEGHLAYKFNTGLVESDEFAFVAMRHPGEPGEVVAVLGSKEGKWRVCLPNPHITICDAREEDGCFHDTFRMCADLMRR